MKLFAGRHHTRASPTTDELVRFGRQVCELSRPAEVLQRIAAAMDEVLREARNDARIPADLLDRMDEAWRSGMAHAAGG